MCLFILIFIVFIPGVPCGFSADDIQAENRNSGKTADSSDPASADTSQDSGVKAVASLTSMLAAGSDEKRAEERTESIKRIAEALKKISEQREKQKKKR